MSMYIRRAGGQCYVYKHARAIKRGKGMCGERSGSFFYASVDAFAIGNAEFDQSAPTHPPPALAASQYMLVHTDNSLVARDRSP